MLLTNVRQLELLLTRQADVELFDGVRLLYVVFDEAHYLRGFVEFGKDVRYVVPIVASDFNMA